MAAQMTSVRLIQPPGCVASPRVLFAGCPPMSRTSKSRDRALRRISSPAAWRTSAMPVLSGRIIVRPDSSVGAAASAFVGISADRPSADAAASIIARRLSMSKSAAPAPFFPSPSSPIARTDWAMPFSLATTFFAYLRPGLSLSAHTTTSRSGPRQRACVRSSLSRWRRHGAKKGRSFPATAAWC